MALGRNITPGMGEKYYKKDDYYMTFEVAPGQKAPEMELTWDGKIAREWGIQGRKVDAEEWKQALNGHFRNGIEIKGGSFRDENGELARRAGTDYEFTMPKSASIQALVFDDLRILKAHREAVTIAVEKALEPGIGARREHGGKRWETTGEALIGRTTHFTNRSGDPNIHDHVVFLNITRNRDGQYQAMTNDKMMRLQRLTQEVYHAELSTRLRAMGFEIENGRYGEPQIKGYTRQHIQHFSQRADDIQKFLKEKYGVDRESATPEQKQTAWEMTREAKKARDLNDLQKQWQARAQEIGLEKVNPGKKQKDLGEEKRLDVARESLAFSIEHHGERESANKEGEILRTALRASRGKIRFEDLKKVYNQALETGDLIRQTGDGPKQALVTSREALEREKRILRLEKEGRGAVDPIMNPFQAEAALNRIMEKEGLTLNKEQMEAARIILTTEHKYVGINGHAGTGKTTMLRPAVKALIQTGFKVHGIAPQYSAVNALLDTGIGNDGVNRPRTVASWLLGISSKKDPLTSLDSKTVVLIDEAGLINAANLESVMKKIEKAGARAIFVGDVRQYESVEAGPAFWALQKNGMETVSVKKMQRQKNAPEHIREAARLSVKTPALALKKLAGDIREISDPDERYKVISEEYLNSKDLKDTLVLTGTHYARRAVNLNVREALELVGKGREFRVFEAEDFTKAQKKRLETYSPGQEIRFTDDYKSIRVKRGEVGTVISVSAEGVQVMMENGNGLLLDPRRLSGVRWEIGEIEKIEIAPGDRIRMNGNSLKNEGISNGMRGEVLAVETKLVEREGWRERGLGEQVITGKGKWEHKSKFSIEPVLKVKFDGEKEIRTVKITNNLLELHHGYAQTGHSAQGLGAGTVILDLQASSQTLNRRSFYTNLTRTKSQVIGFTDNKKRLTEAVTREQDKTLALDVLEPQQVIQPRRQQEKAHEVSRGREKDLGQDLGIEF